MPSEWAGYILDEYRFAEFPAGARVLDVGCGAGEQLRLLRAAGCEPVGVDPAGPAVARLAAEGFDVREGAAEHLPFEDQSFDGLLCKVVVPYTDERRAIAEWGRVLRPGAPVCAVYHGAGYYLRYLFGGPAFVHRVYAVRALLNSWWYATSGRRIPGWIGDTLYQSTTRLERYYRDSGLALERETPSPTYRGKPVFIYHALRRLCQAWLVLACGVTALQS